MKTIFFFLPLPLLAQTELKPVSVSALNFATEKNRFYQIEKKDGESWKPVGDPIKGDGQKVTRTVAESPESTFRLNELHNQWVLVWRDEFAGDAIDRSKWTNEVNGYGGGNNELQYYSDSPKYSFVKDGKLHLSAYRDPHTTTDGKTQPYSSARLRTIYRGDWTYGRIEIRAKLPSGQGIWPAIWMLPTNSPYGGWASGGEIDIVESQGSNVDHTIGTLHFGDKWPKNAYKGSKTKFPGKNAAEDFHVYAVEWKKDEISWFLDGKKWQTISKKDWFSAAAKKSDTAPFDSPFHLILNVAVGGHFFGGTDQDAKKLPDSAFPQTMLIDYVRVSQWAE
ncbi:MAG: glycoside hydrolase family 16 protein [Akkermansiaceae bacterium]|jgi:beta-glucanase (GH16 family)